LVYMLTLPESSEYASIVKVHYLLYRKLGYSGEKVVDWIRFRISTMHFFMARAWTNAGKRMPHNGF